MTVAGIVLAAGAGSRMGRPKALVVGDDGTPWLAGSVEVLLAGGCPSVTVVLGARAAEAVPLLPEGPVSHVVADDWADGMSASLRAGLSALDDSDAAAALVTLVDLPDVGPEVVRRLLAAAAGPAALARATYDGRPGHPVLIGRRHWRGVIQTLAGDQGARVYLATHDHDDVECGDLATGHDVDRPSEV